MFLGSFLLPEKKKKLTEKKKKKKARPTDPTWQVCPPVKQGLFFFVPKNTQFKIKFNSEDEVILIIEDEVILIIEVRHLKFFLKN